MVDLLNTPELPPGELDSQALPPVPPSVNKGPNYLVMLVVLVVGVVLGYLVFRFYPNKSSSAPAPKVENSLTALPNDAVLIQHCADHKGALYIKPNDIPVGPVYMIFNNALIGIEYMLGKDDFLNGKSYQNLAGLGVKVDHVNIGLLSQGHEGYTAPHYHVDLYNVSRTTEQGILCPGSSPAAAATPSATVSATPSAR